MKPWIRFLGLLQREAGGSLPGVLIAVAVGAVLMGAFLSHVSTRMISLGAVEDKLEEEYAVDAAVEFAAWTLLNDSPFQDSVDAAYPNPVNVTPAITVNGLTPSISAAAVNQRGWSILAATSDTLNQGGDLTYGGGALYALWWQGNSMEIWRYMPSSDSWTTITNGPSGAQIQFGTDITYGGSGRIYAVLGNQSDEFWEYTVGGSWVRKDDLPGRAGPGSDMVEALGNIYLLQGGQGQGDDGFWRYSISSNSWSTLPSAPGDVSDGGAIAFDGGAYLYALAGGETNNFWRYDIFANSWTSLQPTPGNVGDGGSLAYTGDGVIHALQGGESTALWSYDTSTNSWQVMETAPAAIDRAGSITWDFEDFIYVLRGNNSTDFWRYLSAPPKYDLTAQAGSTTLLNRIQLAGPEAINLWWDLQ